MTRVSAVALTILTLSPFSVAQRLHQCTFNGTSFLGHADGISTRRVTLIEKAAKVDATIFVPDSNDPLPAIVFTNSAIHGPYNDSDLLAFARGLARAGAASIVLDGAIEWQSPNDDSIRPEEFRFCAGQWLFQNLNLDLHRLADAGNFRGGWIPDGLNFCGIDYESGRAACWPGGVSVGFGQISPAESKNTDEMLKPDGVLFTARWIQRELKLREINPQWFADVVSGTSDAAQ